MGLTTFAQILAEEKFLTETRRSLQVIKLGAVVELLDDVLPTLCGHDDFGKLRSCRRAVVEALCSLGEALIPDPLDPPTSANVDKLQEPIPPANVDYRGGIPS